MCGVVFASHSFADGNEIRQVGVVVGDVSLKISDGVSVCFPGDLRVLDGGVINNSGNLWFVTDSPSELKFDNYASSSGNFIFSGAADCILNGNVDWGNVVLNKQGGRLSVEKTLSVYNSLELKSGVLESLYNPINIKNNLPGALKFSNVLGNNSYIIGALTRKVSPDGNYWYPIGDEAGFHPFLVQNPSGEEDITVNYDPNLSKEWIFSINGAPFTIENIGGWEVDATNDFSAGVSLIDRNRDKLSGANYSIVHAATKDDFMESYKWINSTIPTDQFYLLGAEKYKGGYYVLASEGDLQIMNFTFVDGVENNTFEVPEVGKYSQVELIVYTRWGLKIYENKNYNNDFNCADFPQGTYFYDMKLHQGESVSRVRNIIEIKREKD